MSTPEHERTFAEKLDAFLASVDDVPPSLFAFRSMLAIAFLTGATSYAMGDVTDDELKRLCQQVNEETKPPQEH